MMLLHSNSNFFGMHVIIEIFWQQIYMVTSSLLLIISTFSF
jgi:hypothetical protein